MVKHAGIRLFEMLKDDFMTDVTFIVQGTEIKGHRAVASCQEGLLRELLVSENKRIEIDDISPQTLITVLEYLYTDECEISCHNVFELMHAAKKFHLTDLEVRCANTNLLTLSETNVGALTAQALNFGAGEFLKQCLDFFGENTSKVVVAKEFLEISEEVLLTFCGTDRIKCSQMQLFTGCIRWAEKECQRRNQLNSPENLRAVLKDVLQKLQFENMSMEDFLEFVAPLEILPHDEVGKLIAGWQKKKKYNHWTDEIPVMIKNYACTHGSWYMSLLGKMDKCYEDTTLLVPLSTRISQLKAMKIFDGGKTRCPPELFTISHEGNVLADDATLASIYTPGNELVLKIHTITVTVREENDKWTFPLTMNADDVEKKDLQIIRGHLDIHKGIPVEKVRIIYPEDQQRFPGCIYKVTYVN